jgi:hypothetical protein
VLRQPRGKRGSTAKKAPKTAKKPMGGKKPNTKTCHGPAPAAGVLMREQRKSSGGPAIDEGAREFLRSFLLFIGPERIQKRPIFATLFRRLTRNNRVFRGEMAHFRCHFHD